jgi:5-methylcytosine-specific restriction protein A
MRANDSSALMPRAPKKCGRPGCEERVTGGTTYCPDHTEAWAGAGRGSTRAWRRTRAQVLEEEPTCRDCGAPSTEAGHIVPKAYGGGDERSNLKGQCTRCNRAQIAIDRRRWSAR